MRVNGVCTSLLYGEILPEGIIKAMEFLGAHSAGSLLDVGSGRGTLAFFVFLCYPSISRVTGVEISGPRFSLCVKAMKRLPSARVRRNFIEIELAAAGPSTGNGTVSDDVDDDSIAPPMRSRRLRFYRRNIMKMIENVRDMAPDIVIFDVEINFGSQELVSFLAALKPGCRILSYEDLGRWWQKSREEKNAIGEFPFEHFGSGQSFLTSWAPNTGYKFMAWRKKQPPRMLPSSQTLPPPRVLQSSVAKKMCFEPSIR